MKLNEIIELNGKEYKVELNRESIVRIEQYTKMQEAMQVMAKTPYRDKSKETIKKDENPFAEEIKEETIEKLADEKTKTLEKILTRAFWIWLYPQEKLNYDEVCEILQPYFDDEQKARYLAEKYQYFTEKSVEVREQYQEQQKNLKAQAN